LLAAPYAIGDDAGPPLSDPPETGQTVFPGTQPDPELAHGAPPGAEVTGQPGGPMTAIGTPLPPRYLDGVAIFRLTYTPRDYAGLPDEQRQARHGQYELGRYVSRQEEPALEAIPLSRLVAGGAAQLVYAEGPGGVKGQVVREAGVKQLPTGS